MRAAERLVISRRRIDVLQGEFDNPLFIKKTINDISKVIRILSGVKVSIPDSVDRDSLKEIEKIFKKVFFSIKDQQPVYILSLVRSFLLDDLFSDFYIDLLEEAIYIHSKKEVLTDIDFTDLTSIRQHSSIKQTINESILFLKDKGFSIRETQAIMLNSFFIPLSYSYVRDVIVKNRTKNLDKACRTRADLARSFSSYPLAAKNFTAG